MHEGGSAHYERSGTYVSMNRHGQWHGQKQRVMRLAAWAAQARWLPRTARMLAGRHAHDKASLRPYRHDRQQETPSTMPPPMAWDLKLQSDRLLRCCFIFKQCASSQGCEIRRAMSALLICARAWRSIHFLFLCTLAHRRPTDGTVFSRKQVFGCTRCCTLRMSSLSWLWRQGSNGSLTHESQRGSTAEASKSIDKLKGYHGLAQVCGTPPPLH